tara:strand:- start:1970 stop:2173 length:204 start_codon:yes stop_codon:yes gene_type:complete
MTLIEALKQKQSKEGMSQRDFARHLTIEPVQYWKLVYGKRGFGRKTLRKVFRLYPDLLDVFVQEGDV